MQTVGPYTLLTPVGAYPIGETWSAVDGDGRPVTVARLVGRAADDQRWREAFAATATALAQARVDRLPVLSADFQAPTPWVACAIERGPGAAQVFIALGQTPVPITPTPEPGAEPAEETVPVGAPMPAPSRRARPWDAPPSIRSAATGPPTPVDPELTVKLPDPPPAPMPPGPASSGPTSAGPASSGARTAMAPLPPRLTRRGPGPLLLGLVAVLAFGLGAAGGAAAVVGLRGGGVGTDPTPSAAAPPDLALPTAPPTRPGIEPPQGGGWPADWPEFADEPTRRMADLPGLGFSFDVPPGWSCTRRLITPDAAAYRCGTPDGAVGGDVIVRTCPGPCTSLRRAELRRMEEAFGLQWIRSARFTTWAQSDQVAPDRYGFVYVSYWRSVPEDAIDRQLVLRLTAPPGRADEVRKVAASIRAVTFTI